MKLRAVLVEEHVSEGSLGGGLQTYTIYYRQIRAIETRLRSKSQSRWVLSVMGSAYYLTSAPLRARGSSFFSLAATFLRFRSMALSTSRFFMPANWSMSSRFFCSAFFR